MVSSESAIKALLKVAPVISSVETQLLMRDAYETTYGIHDHARQTDDMSLIRHRPAENIDLFDPTPERMKAYHAAQVLKYTGITFDRFLDMPRYVGEMYIQSCLQLLKEEVEARQKELDRLEEEKRKNGGK
jgi:hypothetical protein